MVYAGLARLIVTIVLDRWRRTSSVDGAATDLVEDSTRDERG